MAKLYIRRNIDKIFIDNSDIPASTSIVFYTFILIPAQTFIPTKALTLVLVLLW